MSRTRTTETAAMRPKDPAMPDEIVEILFTEEQIRARVTDLAQQIIKFLHL